MSKNVCKCFPCPPPFGNITRGKTSQAITLLHFFDHYNFFGFNHFDDNKSSFQHSQSLVDVQDSRKGWKKEVELIKRKRESNDQVDEGCDNINNDMEDMNMPARVMLDKRQKPTMLEMAW